MTTVTNETVVQGAADAVIAKAVKPSKKVAKKVDVAPAVKATIDWANIDNRALTSQGVAIATMARSCKALGRTHEQAKTGEWRETAAFKAFKTDYFLQLGNALGDEQAKARGGVIIRFALRSLRVNLTPDVLEKTTGKVQTVLEEKEAAWNKAGRTKTDHSLGGLPGKGGRPSSEPKSAYVKALDYCKGADLTGEERRKLLFTLAKEWKVDLTKTETK